MKNLVTINKLLLTFSVFLLIIICSCKKDDGVDNDETQDLNEDLTYTEINVILPDGSNITTQDLTVISNLEDSSISSGGKVSIPHTSENRSLAILVNQEKKPVLIGFIHEGNSEISVASTLEALYYYGLGTYFLNEPVKDEYFKQSSSLKDFENTVNEFEEAFKNNSNFLNSNEFFVWFEEKLELIRNDDIENMAMRSVLVDANDVRSGIQVFEDTGLNIKIANDFRRRAHAFLYKTKVKPYEDTEQVIISDIVSTNAAAVKDIEIKPIKAKREFLGIIGDWASGVGVEFFRTETEPLELNLEDHEEYANYKVRVVGPAYAIVNEKEFTLTEREKLDEVIYETLALDYILPAFMDLVGEAKLLDEVNEKHFEHFTKTLNTIVNSVPATFEALKKGDYKTAVSSFFESFYGNAIGELKDDLIEAFRDGLLNYKISISNGNNLAILKDSQEIVNKFNGLNKYLEWTDKILKLSDYLTIIAGTAKSNYLEEWDVKAKQDPVTLEPQEPIAFPYIKTYIEAIVKNKSLASGEVYVYDWEVTGTYGKIFDTKGHEGSSFQSSDKEVYYLSEIDDDDLPENAEETLITKVYVKQGANLDLVGSDTIAMKVLPYKYQILPDGATINGNSSLNLKILRPDYTEDVTNNPQLDYKIVWRTSGIYGTFSGGDKTITTYNSNVINYKALDEDVEHGVESVSAHIYGKLKSEPNSGYELYDEISAEVNIKNDEEKLYFVVPAEYISWGPEVGDLYTSCGSYVVFKVNAIENAINYQATILEYSHRTTPSVIGRSESWTPESRELTSEGVYHAFENIRFQSIGTPNHLFTGCPESPFASLKGAAQIVVTVKK
ncbi:hypothetical protein J1D01_10240 [Seonamhaeicola sp. NFXS20]|uniref:hypothetical protein n=1 Tax=Seonamhaeicola sp. NFXS20 TaxID=2816959 RepID=UPI003B8CA923